MGGKKSSYVTGGKNLGFTFILTLFLKLQKGISKSCYVALWVGPCLNNLKLEQNGEYVTCR